MANPASCPLQPHSTQSRHTPCMVRHPNCVCVCVHVYNLCQSVIDSLSDACLTFILSVSQCLQVQCSSTPTPVPPCTPTHSTLSLQPHPQARGSRLVLLSMEVPLTTLLPAQSSTRRQQQVRDGRQEPSRVLSH